MTDPTIGEHYRASRERLSGLLRQASPDDWRVPVPACPGWDVHDVVAHLTAVVVDANAGRLTGPPTPDVTAEQVVRYRSTAPDDLLAEWEAGADGFEQAITALGIWPAAIDAGSHEHDVRGALGRPGARDCPLVVGAAQTLVEELDCGIPIEVAFRDVGGTARSAGDGAPLALRATAFEVFRFRLGRRSRDQVAALDWSAPPGDGVLDRLFVFGPADP
ncbi:MAG TPA: maleylpyruvate isomerase family mycothiol-dependent enzyme, partial [Acidimicrobiales bacterium]|nr:maleylpyruvate isomerase family mycothiol-dependent enzyme [Acidimicrobiales bacterium]